MSTVQMPEFERPVFKAETAEDLRELITQAELIVANLRGAGGRAQSLLFLLDTIDTLYATLKETGVDLRAEVVRIETVHRLLLSNDGVLVSQIGRLGGLARAREAVKPAPAQWWWFLDARVAERRRQQLQRLLLIAGGVVAALLIFSFVMGRLFPTDPKRLAAMDKTNAAEQALAAGDKQKAAELYREAAAILPDDAETQLALGTVEEDLGNADAAAQAYAKAEQALGSQAQFYMMRGMARLKVGQVDQAMEDAKASLAADPNLAEGYYLLGSVYESKGDAQNAIAAFQEAADKAEAANNSPLIVMAKTRLGMLLQQAPMMSTQEPTPTGSPTS